MAAEAVILYTDRDREGVLTRKHYEIEWRGLTPERSGVWYETAVAARSMATECGAREFSEVSRLDGVEKVLT